MHPEVICLLILLYAGNNYKIYKYFIYIKNIYKVKILYIWVNQQVNILINPNSVGYKLYFILRKIIFYIKSLIFNYILLKKRNIILLWKILICTSETKSNKILNIKNLINNIIYLSTKIFIRWRYILINKNLLQGKIYLHKILNFYNLFNLIKQRKINRKFNTYSMLNSNIISEHIPIKIKPLNDESLGYYLAGLIEGDGHFNKLGNLIICYDLKDISAAYYIKNRLGYGKVSKIKNKNAVTYTVSNSDGILHILNLINNKLKTKEKYDQIINNILNSKMKLAIKFYKIYNSFNIGNINDFNNYWLAGFIDANGSFQIKIIPNITNISEYIPNYEENILTLQEDKSFSDNNKNLLKNEKEFKSREIRLKLQITQKNIEILNYIKYFLSHYQNNNLLSSWNDKISLGGNILLNDIKDLDKKVKGIYIGKRIHPNKNVTYYLETTSFSTFKNVINYLDKYPLLSYKYLNYIYIRKAYLIYQNKEHRTFKGLNKIIKLKFKMSYNKIS